jgi:predicted nucleic acid-binding Zn ribbon protein
MERINYMIHMMEEQQYEKTNNITEEFILYVLWVYLRYLSWIRLAILESTRARHRHRQRRYTWVAQYVYILVFVILLSFMFN